MKNIESIQSKLFFAPINLGYSVNGQITEEVIAFMQKRSGVSVGISVLGNVAVSIDHRSNLGTLVLNEESDLDLWMKYTNLTSQNGCIPGIQIASMHKEINPQRGWINNTPAFEFERLNSITQSISYNEIDQLFEKFDKTIRLALSVGFKYIEIHAAHGYYLSLLLDNRINTNLNKHTYVVNKIKELTNIINPTAFSAIRISLTNGHDNQISHNIGELDKILDFVSFSDGYYTINKKAIYPNRHKRHTPIQTMIEYCKNNIKCNSIIAGDIRVQELLQYYNEPSIYFGLGRPLIADEEFASKYFNNKHDEIKNCEYKGHCHHFSTNNVKGVVCPIWRK